MVIMSNEKCSSVYLRHELLRHECVRKSTFHDWPNKNFDFRSLVKAGFYYSKNSDEVIAVEYEYAIGLKIHTHILCIERFHRIANF